MKQYIKPNIILYAVNMQHLMTGSRSDNQVTGDGDKTHTGGNSAQGGGSGDSNGNVEDMAKEHFTWDD